MKKTLWIIKVHSMVDVITNSSSELFVIKHNAVGKLQKVLEAICKNHKYKYDVVFEKLQVLDHHNKKNLVNTVMDFRGFNYLKGLTFDGTTFLLYTNGENTIDMETMEDIENALDCVRMHLG